MSIKLHAPNATMLLVGTHLDEVSEKKAIGTTDQLIRKRLLSLAKFDYLMNGQLTFFPVDNKGQFGMDEGKQSADEGLSEGL